MTTPRILTLFIEQKDFKDGYINVSEKLYEIIDEEDIESLKYFIQSATQDGLYISIALVTKSDKDKGTVGFK